MCDWRSDKLGGGADESSGDTSAKEVKKGWGKEVIWADEDDYAGKLLMFMQDGQMSLHFHKNKDETWYVLEGEFELTLIDLGKAERQLVTLRAGDVWRNRPLEPHSLRCTKTGKQNWGVIAEVSTRDQAFDNYRIEPGDSQNKNCA